MSLEGGILQLQGAHLAGEPIFPFPQWKNPFFSSINAQFLWEGYFPVKMPTRCGNNRASPASEEFEKVKESLKDVWVTQGRENTKMWGEPLEFSPLPGDASPVASLAGKQNIWGEEWKKLIIYQRFDAFPELPGRETEERPRNTEFLGLWNPSIPNFGRMEGPRRSPRQSLTWELPNPAHAVVLNRISQVESKITSGLFFQTQTNFRLSKTLWESQQSRGQSSYLARCKEGDKSRGRWKCALEIWDWNFSWAPDLSLHPSWKECCQKMHCQGRAISHPPETSAQVGLWEKHFAFYVKKNHLKTLHLF